MKMVVCAPQQQQLLLPSLDPVSIRRCRNCSNRTNLLYSIVPNATPPRKPFVVPSSSVLHQMARVSDEDNNGGNNQQIFREHNTITTAHRRRQSSDEKATSRDDVKEAQTITESRQEEEEKVRLLEMSLVKRKSPRFAGSIYLQSRLESGGRNSPPPLHRLFREGATDIDDDKMLMRALEIRRKVTAEIFKEEMRGGKFSITFSTNLVSRLPDFVDHIMIEAVCLKRLPEFSHCTFNIRAKSVIHNSNVIPFIRWLKHNSLTYPQIGKLICMSCENLELIRQKIEWLKTIHVKGEFLGVTLAKAGGNVLQRSTQELDEIVCYLENNGVRREWLGSIVSCCPPLLGYTMEEVKSRVNFYLDMDMNEKDFGSVVFDYPKALGFFTLEDMNSKVQYLKEFGLSNEDVGRLLAIKPQLMGCSIEERWKPLVKYLYYLGVRRDGMRRILTSKPMVFCVDLETTIAPKVRFLQDIGIREEAIGGMLVKFPPLLTYSLYKKIRPVVIFLIAEGGVTKRDIGKVIALGPELLGCSIVNKLEINVKYLLSLGIPLHLLGEMIADFPMLLKYNLDVLRPKYSYLRRIMVRTLQDLIEFPSILVVKQIYEPSKAKVLSLAPLTRPTSGMKYLAADRKKIKKRRTCSLGCSTLAMWFSSGSPKKPEINPDQSRPPTKQAIDWRPNLSLFLKFYLYKCEGYDPPTNLVMKIKLRYDVFFCGMNKGTGGFSPHRFFSYSLDGRIIPRHKVLVENRINFKLHYMLACSDELFNQRVVAAVERRQKFECGVINDPPDFHATNSSIN